MSSQESELRKAVELYRSEMTNPAKDLIMCRLRRDEMFALLSSPPSGIREAELAVIEAAKLLSREYWRLVKVPRTTKAVEVMVGSMLETELDPALSRLASLAGTAEKPNIVPMVLYCPAGHQHIDEGEWATRPHKTHQCQHAYEVTEMPDGGMRATTICGEEWRPANFPTVGVASLAGTKEGER